MLLFSASPVVEGSHADPLLHGRMGDPLAEAVVDSRTSNLLLTGALPDVVAPIRPAVAVLKSSTHMSTSCNFDPFAGKFLLRIIYDLGTTCRSHD